jgi:uncharacterized protein YpmB
MRKLILIASLVCFSAVIAAPASVMAANDKPAKSKRSAAKKPQQPETDEQKARRIGAKYGVTW